MSMEERAMMAVCGLDCGGCEIRLAPTDARAAEQVVAWFQEMGWLQADEGIDEALERDMYCQGCHGDRTAHWSADCWILQCCVDEKGLSFCYECPSFPCEPLRGWAKENEAYARALRRLQEVGGAG
jgi:hypothetical protein